MVRPPVSTRNRLCHQHVPLFPPPDENKVQQLPLSRPSVQPAGLLSQREAEVDFGQDESVFCSVSQEEQTIVVGALETMGIQHSSTVSTICAKADVEVTKGYQLIRLRHSRQEGVQFHLGCVPCGVDTGYRANVDADGGG
ncbi:hypothetical protein SprV_0100307300 [Sparganum proliferum]